MERLLRPLGEWWELRWNLGEGGGILGERGAVCAADCADGAIVEAVDGGSEGRSGEDGTNPGAGG